MPRRQSGEEIGVLGEAGLWLCRIAAREGIWESNGDASPHGSLNKEAVV